MSEFGQARRENELLRARLEAVEALVEELQTVLMDLREELNTPLA